MRNKGCPGEIEARSISNKVGGVKLPCLVNVVSLVGVLLMSSSTENIVVQVLLVY